MRARVTIRAGRDLPNFHVPCGRCFPLPGRVLAQSVVRPSPRRSAQQTRQIFPDSGSQCLDPRWRPVFDRRFPIAVWR